MDRGYVKLWRKSLDSSIMQNPDLFMFWCWCLMRANYRERKTMIGFQEIDLAPGQFIFGRDRASESLPMSVRTIRTCIDKLKKLGNLTIKTTNKFSIISIVNWHIYQGEDEQNDQQNDQQTTSKRPANDHRQTLKALKEEKTKNTCANPDGLAPSNGNGNRHVYQSDFEKAWNNHGRKDGSKFGAEKKWIQLKRSGQLPELQVILDAQNKQRESRQWRDGYCPHFQTWLNGRRWETAECESTEAWDNF